MPAVHRRPAPTHAFAHKRPAPTHAFAHKAKRMYHQRPMSGTATIAAPHSSSISAACRIIAIAT
jgi:hypothetical protein